MITAERIYVDSNVLIYFVEGLGELATLARTALNNHNASGGRLYTSELTLGECLRGAYRKDKIYVDAYLDMLRGGPMFVLAPVALEIIKRAAFLGAQLNMKLVDAIHVATAETLECSVFLTNDRGIRAPVGIELRYLSSTA